jgi:hypothetical protein
LFFLQSNRPITVEMIEILRKAADQLDFDNLAAILLDNDPTYFIEMARGFGDRQ